MNEMRKLMEAVQFNEHSIDDFSNEDLITQLAQNIAEYTMRNMNLTHKGADAVRRVAPEYAEGMAARFINDLHNEINVEIQVLIDDFVDDDRRGVVDPVEEESVEVIGENRNPREATIALIELMDEGVLDPRAVADAALSYMSESEVEDMADSNYFFGESVEEGKYNYPKGMKGRGGRKQKTAGPAGQANRRERKAFRKAEKAKAHQARMRGEVDEGFDEGMLSMEEYHKKTFIDGWEWALATDWNDQLKSDEAYERYERGESKPESY